MLGNCHDGRFGYLDDAIDERNHARYLSRSSKPAYSQRLKGRKWVPLQTLSKVCQFGKGNHGASWRSGRVRNRHRFSIRISSLNSTTVVRPSARYVISFSASCTQGQPFRFICPTLSRYRQIQSSCPSPFPVHVMIYAALRGKFGLSNAQVEWNAKSVDWYQAIFKWAIGPSASARRA